MNPVARNMAAVTLTPLRVFQHSPWDLVLVLLAAAHGVLLLTVPGVLVIAVGLWWNSNSISHNFIHNPYFRSRILNQGFAAFLSVLLGFPHALWRTRHLAHHAGTAPRIKWSAELAAQTGLVLLLWVILGALQPRFFLTVYLPGWALGLGLCAVQGHYEHARGTVSCYGRLYNILFFNDGFHAEHHVRPRAHWTRLSRLEPQAAASRWPPVLRWLDAWSLEGLERIVLRSGRLQRFVLGCHEQAFASLLATLPDVRDQGLNDLDAQPADQRRNSALRSRTNTLGVRRVGIVGGGLFPRTAIILRKLLPEAKLVVIDLSRENLDAARQLLSGDVELVHATFDPETHNEFDLLVIPLSLKGDRTSLYRSPPARLVFIHDWLWRRGDESVVVSALLLKRLNLVRS